MGSSRGLSGAPSKLSTIQGAWEKPQTQLAARGRSLSPIPEMGTSSISNIPGNSALSSVSPGKEQKDRIHPVDVLSGFGRRRVVNTKQGGSRQACSQGNVFL